MHQYGSLLTRPTKEDLASVYEANVKDPDMHILRYILERNEGCRCAYTSMHTYYWYTAHVKLCSLPRRSCMRQGSKTQKEVQHASHSHVTAAATAGQDCESQAADILNMRRMQPNVVALELVVTETVLLEDQLWCRICLPPLQRLCRSKVPKAPFGIIFGGMD